MKKTFPVLAVALCALAAAAPAAAVVTLPFRRPVW